MKVRRAVACLGASSLVAVAAYAFVGAASQEAKLVSGSPHFEDNFGWSVAVDGDTAVIGDLGRDDLVRGKGWAEVFTRTDGAWRRQARLDPDDLTDYAHAGNAVALSGDTALVGASSQGSGNRGAAYVFVRNGAAWTQQAKLVAPDPRSQDYFGDVVALSTDTAAVGRYSRTTVEVFRRDGDTWQSEASLLPSLIPFFSTGFGESIAIDGDTLVVGAPGQTASVYVFRRSGATWTEEARLRPSDAVGGDAGFGGAVAISGDSLIVGHEPRHAAYVFRRTGTVWTEEAKLDVDFNTGNRFDRVVAISGDTVVVSSPYGGAGGAGAAYVFRRAGAAWTYRAKLVAADGGVQSNENYSAGTFGASIALSGETLLVGAPEKSAATGAAYVFRIAPDAAPSPPAPPGYLLASKVRARIDAERPERSKLLVTGTIDTGADAPDFSGPATFDVGGLHLDVPSLVASGKSLVHRADDVVLTLKPSAVGSSRVPFTLTVIGARVSDVAPDATADVRFRNAAHDVGGSVRLAAGSLRRRGLVGPAFHLIKASGVLKGGGEDSFRLALGFAGAGGLPASVDEPITVEFGDALSATFPGASFKRRGATFVRTDGGPGITRAAFDYARGVVTIVGAGLDLGALVEGGNAVTIRVARGDDARTATVRLVRAGKKLAY